MLNQPNTITVDGYFINNITSGAISGLVQASDYTDNAYIKVAGETIPPGETYHSFDVVKGTGVPYSIEVSNLKDDVTMRLLFDSNPRQVCFWYFHPNNSVPEADGKNPPVCMLSGAYDFVMQIITNK